MASNEDGKPGSKMSTAYAEVSTSHGRSDLVGCQCWCHQPCSGTWTQSNLDHLGQDTHAYCWLLYCSVPNLTIWWGTISPNKPLLLPEFSSIFWLAMWQGNMMTSVCASSSCRTVTAMNDGQSVVWESDCFIYINCFPLQHLLLYLYIAEKDKAASVVLFSTLNTPNQKI